MHNQLENTYSRLADSYHDHYRGELVNYNDTVLLIAGAQTRDVDLLENASSWRMINEVPAKMKSFGAVNLNGFIYIFGELFSFFYYFTGNLTGSASKKCIYRWGKRDDKSMHVQSYRMDISSSEAKSRSISTQFNSSK